MPLVTRPTTCCSPSRCGHAPIATVNVGPSADRDTAPFACGRRRPAGSAQGTPPVRPPDTLCSPPSTRTPRTTRWISVFSYRTSRRSPAPPQVARSTNAFPAAGRCLRTPPPPAYRPSRAVASPKSARARRTRAGARRRTRKPRSRLRRGGGSPARDAPVALRRPCSCEAPRWCTSTPASLAVADLHGVELRHRADDLRADGRARAHRGARDTARPRVLQESAGSSENRSRVRFLAKH